MQRAGRGNRLEALEVARPSEAARRAIASRFPTLAKIPPGLAIAALVTFAMALWRAAYVAGGIDPDSDAYAHHCIAREILVEPKNLHVHWVWLPLFHYVQAAGIALFGLTMQAVRYVNVAISAAVPLVLYFTLRAHRKGRDDRREDIAPPLAAVLCAMNPIAMQMGTTGQTEPVFQLVVALVCLFLAIDRTRWIALVLGLGVVLRYEAWSIVCALIGLLAVELVLRRPVPVGQKRISPLAVVAPIAMIVVWAAVRHEVEGAKWFAFVGETREFANGALKAKSSFELGTFEKDVLHYVYEIPDRVIGAPLWLAPVGLVRTFRRDGLRFTAVSFAVLGFVTFAWVMRSSLGLDRHFVALVPLYATLMANGVAQLADGAKALASYLGRRNEHAFLAGGSARFAVMVGLVFATMLQSRDQLQIWMRDWRAYSDQLWPDRRDVAGYLDALPPTAKVLCDEPTIEVLSHLDRHRIDRHDLGGVPPEVLAARARSEGTLYVVTWAVRANKYLTAGLGTLVFRPSGTWKDDEGIKVVRIDPAP